MKKTLAVIALASLGMMPATAKKHESLPPMCAMGVCFGNIHLDWLHEQLHGTIQNQGDAPLRRVFLHASFFKGNAVVGDGIADIELIPGHMNWEFTFSVPQDQGNIRTQLDQLFFIKAQGERTTVNLGAIPGICQFGSRC